MIEGETVEQKYSIMVLGEDGEMLDEVVAAMREGMMQAAGGEQVSDGRSCSFVVFIVIILLNFVCFIFFFFFFE